MLKIELLKELLVIAIALSTVTCSFVQKTKRLFKCSNCLCHYSFLVNMLFSIFFCITFTTVDFPHSLWVGLFSFLGADTIFKTLEGKLSSYKDLVSKELIYVKKQNLIKTEDD